MLECFTSASKKAKSTEKEMKNNWVLAPVLFGIVVRFLLLNENIIRRNKLPGHLLGHKIYIEKQLLKPEVGRELVDLVDSIGLKKGYPTNTADVKFYHTEHEHIGEAIKAKVMPDGRVICDNSMTI